MHVCLHSFIVIFNANAYVFFFFFLFYMTHAYDVHVYVYFSFHKGSMIEAEPMSIPRARQMSASSSPLSSSSPGDIQRKANSEDYAKCSALGKDKLSITPPLQSNALPREQ